LNRTSPLVGAIARTKHRPVVVIEQPDEPHTARV
jgi:hypothetical protein